MAKEKMSLEKKTKLIYSGELMIFAILFLVLATLEILNVIGKKPITLNIFNFVTAAGGAWMIVDFFWVLFSKKRRKKNSLLDKALVVPATIFIAPLSIYQLANGITSFIPWQIGSGLCYLSLLCEMLQFIFAGFI